jgi:hypothetical protein
VPVGLIQVRKWTASRHGQDQSRGGSVRAEGRKPKALLREVRLGFIEQIASSSVPALAPLPVFPKHG